MKSNNSWVADTSLVLKLDPGIGPVIYKLDINGNLTPFGYSTTANVNRRRPYELNAYIVESYGWRINDLVAHPMVPSIARLAFFRHREARMNYLSVDLSVLSIPFARMDQTTFDYHRGSDPAAYWSRLVGDLQLTTPYGIRTKVNNWPYDHIQRVTPAMVGAY